MTTASQPPVSEADEVVRAVLAALRGHRFDLSNEKATQRQIADRLTAAGLAVSREHRLCDRDIPDFLVEGCVAVEVKIGGRKMDIYRQCARYCAHADVRALVLASNVPMGFPETIDGRPCYVLNLGAAWL